MKKLIITTLLFLSLNKASLAIQKSSILEDGIKNSQLQWEDAKYRLKNKKDRLMKYEECAIDAQNLAISFPNEASPLIWQGICTASQAEILKISGLGKAKEAKEIFEKALKINEKELSGSSYVNLGVLYQRVPGWPIGFGNKKIAEENFKKALEISPENIDANYFYGIFLAENGNKESALKFLNKGIQGPGRGRPFADMKRKEEIQNKINELAK